MQSKPRYIIHSGATRVFDAQAEITRHASLLVARYPPTASTFKLSSGPDLAGLYSGPTSIAYTLYVLRDDLPALIEGRSPIEWSKLYLVTALEMFKALPPEREQPTVGTVDASFCGYCVEVLAYAVTAAAVHDDEQLLAPLWNAMPRVIADAPEGKPTNDEFIAGRAGFLFFLRFMMRVFPSLADRADDAAAQVGAAILRRAPHTDDPWRFAKRLYLGLGHGWAGIIAQLLLSDPAKSALARPWVHEIIRAQRDNGNWTPFIDRDDPSNKSIYVGVDTIVQSGIGGTGVVLCLLAMRPVYEAANDEETVHMIDTAVPKAQKLVWEQGFLTKESCIMHGAAGSSLVLFDPKQRATCLAASVQEEVDQGNEDGTHEPSDTAGGLARGLSGRLWAMVMYGKGKMGMFPAFSDY